MRLLSDPTARAFGPDGRPRWPWWCRARIAGSLGVAGSLVGVVAAVLLAVRVA